MNSAANLDADARPRTNTEMLDSSGKHRDEGAENQWQPAALGDLIDLFDSQRVPLSSSERMHRQGEYRYYGAQGVIDYIDDYIFDGRYILVAEDGENLNSRKLPLALIADGKFWVNNHAHILRGKQGVMDDKYLLHALNHMDIRPYVTGAAQPKLSQGNLRGIVLRVPPLAEQRRIAGILSAYDDLIENCQRRIRILEEMARRLYREWFVHYRYPGHESIPLTDSPLGSIPRGWEVKTLASICCRMESGGTPSRSKEEFWAEGTIDWYKTKELWDGHLFESEERISEAGLAKSSARVFEAGTLLMAIYGSPTVGRLGIVTRPSCCNQAALGMVADPTFASQTFLYYLLMELREHFNSIAQGAAQQNISKEKVACAVVALPPRDLIARFDSVAGPIFDQLAVLNGASRNLRRTRDLLLPRLLSGGE